MNDSAVTKATGCLLLFFLLTAGLVIASETDSPDTRAPSPLIVDPAGNGDHTTIQAAVDAASNGQTVEIWAGVYVESISISSHVDLKGNGSSETIIISDSDIHTIEINANDVDIQDLMATSRAYTGDNAGIYIRSGSENVTITNCNVSYGDYGIYSVGSATNNNKNLIIENVTADHCTYGIRTTYSDQTKVRNCTCYASKTYGMYLYYSDNIEVAWNNCSYAKYGMKIGYCDDSDIHNNTFLKDETGLLMFHGANNIISDNHIWNAWDYGIHNDISDSNTIKDNHIIDCGHPYTSEATATAGLYLDTSNTITLKDNHFSRCGLYLYSGITTDFNSHTMVNNDIDGRSIEYRVGNLGPPIPVSSGQVIIISGSGYNVMGANLSGASTGVQLYYADNNRITNCDLSDNSYGLWAKYADGNQIDNCKIDNCFNAMELIGSSTTALTRASIHNNTFEGNYIGIDTSYLDISDIMYNTFRNTTKGSVDMDNSDTNSIHNNTIEYVSYRGFEISTSDDNLFFDNDVSSIDGLWGTGSYLSSADNNAFGNNDLTNLGYAAFHIASGGNNDFANNKMVDCGFLITSTTSSYWATNNIPTSNTVNSKMVFKTDSASGGVVPNTVGQVIISNSEYISMSDLNLNNATVGVLLYNSDDCEILGCDLSNGSAGIWAYDSDRTNIENNSINNNGMYGVYYRSCEYATIANNTLDTNGYPLSPNGEYGFYSYSSRYLNLKDNDFFKCGFYLHQTTTASYHVTHRFQRNDVNGRDLVYWVSRSNANIDSRAGQVILVECQNIKIRNCNLSDATVGVETFFCESIDIINCTANSNIFGILHYTSSGDAANFLVDLVEANWCQDYGVRFYSSSSNDLDNVTIGRSSFDHCMEDGIYIYYPTSEVRIHNTTCSYADDDGIYIYASSSSRCDGVRIEYNTLTNCEDGMYLAYGNDLWVHQNYVRRNVEEGFYLASCLRGYVTFNDIQYNQLSGIESTSDQMNFSSNIIAYNRDHGLQFTTAAENNEVVFNVFYHNVGQFKQVIDDDTANVWDNGAMGNWWSDWTSPDIDGNGIVDEPYLLMGVAYDQDNYPLVPQSIQVLPPANLTPMEDVLYEDSFTLSNPAGKVIWSIDTNASWLSSGSAGQIFGTPSIADAGIYYVNATATNILSLAWKNVTLEVGGLRHPPIITTIPPTYADEDTNYTVLFNATDVDSSWESFAWSVDSEPGIFRMNGRQLWGELNNSLVGSWWINVTVHDDLGLNSSLNYTLTVNNTNDPPIIIGNDTEYTYEDQLYYRDYDAFDEDPNPGIQLWSLNTNATWLNFAEAFGIISGTPYNHHVGIYFVNVTVRDLDGGENSTNFTLHVLNTNDDPQITTIPKSSVDEDSTYVQKFEVTDEDPVDTTFEFSMRTNAGFLTQTSSNGTVVGTPANDDIGTWWIEVTVTDGYNGSDSVNYTLTVSNTNDPPIITSDDVLNAYAGDLYMAPYTAFDPDPTGDTFTWILDTQAEFLDMDASEGVLHGTPTEDELGDYVVNITVQDSWGAIAWTNFTLNVSLSGGSPTTTLSSFNVFMEEDIVYDDLDITQYFSDPDGDSLTYTNGPDNNVTVDLGADGMVTLTPKKDWAGTTDIWFKASDGAHSSPKVIAKVDVEQINDAPKILTINYEVEYNEDEPILMDAIIRDPDLIYGDVVNYLWYVDGTMESSSEVLNITLEEGQYKINLTIRDEEDARDHMEITISVKGDGVTDGGDGDGDGSVTPSAGILIILGIVLLLIIVAVVITVIMMRRKKAQEEEEEPEEQEKEPTKKRKPKKTEASPEPEPEPLPDEMPDDGAYEEPFPMDIEQYEFPAEESMPMEEFEEPVPEAVEEEEKEVDDQTRTLDILFGPKDDAGGEAPAEEEVPEEEVETPVEEAEESTDEEDEKHKGQTGGVMDIFDI